MKKYLVAFIVTLALCLAVCCAGSADDHHLSITVNNATEEQITSGEYSGSYYYKLLLDTDLDFFQMGWNDDPSQDKPDPEETYVSRVTEWHSDGSSRFIFTLPPAGDDETATDALYYRISDEDPWQRLVFIYALTNTETSEVAVTKDKDPELRQDEFTVTWNEENDADAYLFYWGRDGEEESYLATTNQLTITDKRYGGPEKTLGKVGVYNCRVNVLKNGELLTSEATKQFTVAPVLTLADYNEKNVAISEDGTRATMPLYQWVLFELNSPGASFIKAHSLDEGVEPSDETVYDWRTPDENGELGFQWIQIGNDKAIEWKTPEEGPDEYEYFTVTIVAEAIYGEQGHEQVVYSNPVTVKIEHYGDINEEVTFTVPEKVYNNTNDEKGIDQIPDESGVYEVAQDGRLFVDVNNIDADFFGLYIPGETEDDPWIADSHWIPVSDGDTTRVPLTVPRCEAGEEYEARVFAIKFGSPQKDAVEPIRISVTARDTESPFILSMGDTFTTGEPLRIFAHYTNPDHIEEGQMEIRIRNTENEEDVIYEERGNFADFWDDGMTCWHRGTFAVEARIWEAGEEEEVLHNNEDYVVLKEIEVTADERVVDLQFERFNTITPGEELNIVIHSVAAEATDDMPEKVKADFFSAELIRVDWDWWPIDETEEDADENGDATLTFDGRKFELGASYILRISANKTGSESSYAEIPFAAVAVESPVQIIRTDETEDQTVAVNQEATFRVVKKPDGEEEREICTVSLFDGNGFWEHEGPDNDGAYERSFSFPEDRTYVVYAMVTFDEVPEDFDWEHNEDPRTWYATNVIEVTATKTGETGAFTYTTDRYNEETQKVEAERGELITVTYNVAQYATHYWIDVERYNEESRNWDWISHEADLFTEAVTETGKEEDIAGTMTLSTAGFEAGQRYRIRASAESEGYTRYSTDELDLVITEPEVDPEGKNIHFTVDVPADENGNWILVTGQDYLFSVYAPGADWIDIYYDYDSYDFDRDDGWRDDNHGGESFSGHSSYGNSGTYTLIASAWYPSYDDDTHEPIWEVDDEGNRIQVHNEVKSDPIILNVTSSGEKVVITRPENLPAYIEAGTEDDVTFTVKQPAGADYYNINVWYDSENGGLYGEDGIEDGSREITIRAEELPQEENCVTVKIRAGGYNKEADEKEWKVPIVPADGGKATISITGLGEGNTIPVNKNIKLTVTKAQGVEGEIRTICVHNEYGPMEHEGPDEDGNYERGLSFDNAGIYAIYAMVTFDEVGEDFDWEHNEDPRTWYATNVIEVTATSLGETNPFTIVLSATEVARGEKIHVTFNEPTGEHVDPELNADNYWLNIEGMNEFDWRWVDENQVAEIITTNLRPGEYKLWAGGCAEGLTRYHTEAETITINEPEMGEDRILFTLNGKKQDIEAQIAENVSVSIIAPGATRVGFFEDGNPWHFDEHDDYCWGDECDSWYEYLYWMFKDDAGRHELHAAALFDDEEDWVLSEPLYVTVTSEGILTFDATEVPSHFIDEDNDESKTEQFTISLPEHADWMKLMVWQASETGSDSEPWNTIELVNEEHLTDNYTVKIPHDHLVAGEEIWIEAEAYGLGYAAGFAKRHIQVLPKPAESGATLKFEELTPNDDNEALLNQELKVVLVPDENHTLTAVRFYDGKSFWDDVDRENHPEWFRDEDGAFFAYTRFDMNELVGYQTIYAYYKLDEEEDWLMSEPLVVNVTTLGTIGEYDFAENQPKEVTVKRGDPVTFKFVNAENANRYWVDAFSKADDGGWVSWNPESTSKGTTVTMITAGMPAGEYLIWGRAGKDGWIWTESNNSVTLVVTEADEQSINLNIKENVLTGEEVQWSVYAPEALDILVTGYMDEENPFFVRHSSEESEDTSWIGGRDIFGDQQGTAYVHVEATFEGNTVKTETAEINVVYNPLLAPKISSTRWYTGMDTNLRITIEPDGNTEEYRLRIWDASDTEGDHETYYETPDDQSEQEAKKIIELPYSRIKNASAIGVAVEQTAEGYNSCYTEVFIRPIDRTGLLTLPSALTEIEEEAFMNDTGITHVVIPRGVGTIGDRAFRNCDSLLTVEIQGNKTEFGDDVFDEGNITIYGYSGSDAEKYAKEKGISFVSID